IPNSPEHLSILLVSHTGRFAAFFRSLRASGKPSKCLRSSAWLSSRKRRSLSSLSGSTPARTLRLKSALGEFCLPPEVFIRASQDARHFCDSAEHSAEKLDQLCRIRGNLSFQFKSFQMVLKNCGAPPSSPSPAKTPAASPPPSPFLLAASFASLGSSALSPAVRPGIFSLLKASGEKSADRLVLEPRADDATQEKENGESSEEESTAQPPEGKQETAANRENEKSKETGKKKATKAPGGGGEAEEAPEKKNPREA
ncbi:hypothetical protein TGFOU_402480, partial [Toxoplasma gondii FOU]